MSVERKYIDCIRVAETATFTFEARKKSGGARIPRGPCTVFPARTPAASADLDGGNGQNAGISSAMRSHLPHAPMT